MHKNRGILFSLKMNCIDGDNRLCLFSDTRPEGIAHAEPAREFIPEFDYKIIPLKQYDNNELKKE